MIKQGIEKVVSGVDLNEQEVEIIFNEIMSGLATNAQIAAFIIGLRCKGETIDEITGAAKVMRKFAAKINVRDTVILDTCGTGGDNQHTFNISTLAALIVASAGITVAKHGNRSVSSKSGSADLFEKLGVNVAAEIGVVEKCVNEAGIGFLFAQKFHQAMKYAAAPRKEIGVRTIFNVLGPLTNPAGATHQLLGVFAKDLTKVLAGVLKNLGTKHALVVYGLDGLDEISICGETLISELRDGSIQDYIVKPEQFGIKRADIEQLRITDAEHSLKCALDIFNGKQGPLTDAVILNSAFALYAADGAGSVDTALPKIREVLNTGIVKDKLSLLVKYSYTQP
ncbi:MAG: anthranilate phosphoribosyltransferase [Candidatus Omnitrophota bacterium]|nr:MAG: anthranilate phosphoribosyltransferase [Candidatus Omnitrophota bacterium]